MTIYNTIIKAKGLLVILPVILLSLFFASCEDKNKNRSEEEINSYVNGWIYDEMSFYYLWNDRIPSNPDYTKKPDAFFESLLNVYDANTNPEGDRFSWIQSSFVDLLNALNGVASTDVGFEYGTVRMYMSGSNRFTYWITYVKKNTDAEAKGLRRGHIITMVDGVDVSENNYTSLLRSNKSSYKLEVYKPEMGQYETVIVNVETNYAENPVYFSQIYNKGNRKIGYLMYNFFAADRGNNSGEYDIELNQVLTGFYDTGITDMILDLRYNTGGLVSSTVNLASALVPNRSTQQVFSYRKYNTGLQAALKKQYGESFFYDYFVDKFTVSGRAYQIPKLGDKIGKLYVITGANTASASELIINGLSPFMEVILIGRQTYGKNVGSISIYKNNDSDNKWGMQPIVARSFNSLDESDYWVGFDPDVPLNEVSDSDWLYTIGNDEYETMLVTTLRLITASNSSIDQLKVKKSGFQTIGSSLDHKAGAYQMVYDGESIIKATQE